MNHKRLLPQMIGLTLVVLLLVACGTPQPTRTSVPPTAVPTPIPPTAIPTPISPTATPTPVTPTATPTPVPPTATPTPSHPFFSVAEVLEVPSISATVGEGVVSFMEGDEPGTLRVEAEGTIPAVEGRVCLHCFEIVQMAPNLKLPTEIFAEMSNAQLASVKIEQGSARTYFQSETITLSDGGQVRVLKEPLVIDSMQMLDAVHHIPLNAEASEFIVSGPEGATLRKEGKGFRLVEGEAYLQQTTLP